MNILLADDEHMVRIGLKSMIEELYPSENTYYEVGNGKEVISATKKYSIDVAFIDIKMPLMNGLEAIDNCKEISPLTIWVILTGYADFEYARKSISLSAFDYILKPIEIDTLQNLFEKIKSKKENKFKENNSLFSHDIIESFSIATQFGVEGTEFLPDGKRDFILYQFYINYIDAKTQSAIKRTLYQNIYNYCSNNTSIVNYSLFFTSEDNLCLVCDIADASPLTHFLAIQSECFDQYALSIFWGNRKTVREIYGISQRINHISNLRIVKDCKKPQLIMDLEATPEITSLLSFADSISDIIDSCIEQNQSGFYRSLGCMNNNGIYRDVFSYVDKSVLRSYLQRSFSMDFSFNSFDDLLRNLEKAFGIIQSMTLNFDTITKVTEFVKTNYSQDLGISRISELFQLSPTYFSKQFHEKTGQKYIDYVTSVRIGEAKKLFTINSQITVKQVAEMVGYSSERHFSNVFQKLTGYLPSVYPHNL